MSDESLPLSDLIDAVADGTVSPDALAAASTDEATGDLLRELRVLAGVADVHRSQVAGDQVAGDPVPDGGAAAPRARLPGHDPQRWGNFALMRKVGEGSFGDVYLARDLWLDHEVALKVVKPHVADTSLILHEARKLVRIRQPNVVTVHGADIQGGRAGFWMDFVDGPTLADVIRREGVRSVEEATAWAKDLCRALGAVHAAGLVHRDIKAQNVMRHRVDGRLVLMDFGAGQFTDPRHGPAISAAGTPLYLAPELLDGGRATERSDIYALGVLLFYLVSGRFPLEATSWDDLVLAHARRDGRRLEDLRPDVPDAFAGIVRRMLAPRPDDRFPTVGAVRQALESVATPADPHVATRTERRGNIALLGVVGLGVLAFTGYVCSVFYNSPLGRTAGFDTESPWLWPLWGLRALNASAIVMGGLGIGFVIVRLVGQALLAPVIARVGSGAGVAARPLITALRASPSSQALWALLLQVAIMIVSARVFADVLGGLDSFISRRPPVDFAPLAPENQPRHILFALTVCTQVMVFAAVWFRLARSGWRTATGDTRALVLGGVFLTGVTFYGGQIVPYRILYFNASSERVSYAARAPGERCYLVAARGSEGLLFCPERPPWNVPVTLADPALRREHVLENMFTGLSAPATRTNLAN